MFDYNIYLKQEAEKGLKRNIDATIDQPTSRK